MLSSHTLSLANGTQIPVLGIGTWKAREGEEVYNAVKLAIENGYRHIDTASIYANEKSIGRAVKEAEIQRKELFITTKVWNSDQGFMDTLEAYERSLEKLGLEYIDLYLIHWPVRGKYKETWKALEELYKEEKVKAIGVSNFQIHHLEDLMDDCEIAPMVNQVEHHPLLTQDELRLFCQKNNIVFEAWSPLMQGNLDIPILHELSKKYRKSPAQIILRWNVQNNIVTVPKSVNPSRISENAGIFDFSLSDEDMKKISSLNENKRFGPDPDNFSF